MVARELGTNIPRAKIVTAASATASATTATTTAAASGAAAGSAPAMTSSSGQGQGQGAVVEMKTSSALSDQPTHTNTSKDHGKDSSMMEPNEVDTPYQPTLSRTLTSPLTHALSLLLMHPIFPPSHTLGCLSWPQNLRQTLHFLAIDWMVSRRHRSESRGSRPLWLCAIALACCVFRNVGNAVWNQTTRIIVSSFTGRKSTNVAMASLGEGVLRDVPCESACHQVDTD